MRTEMPVQALQPRGSVGCVADDAVEEVPTSASVPNIHVAVLQPHAWSEVTRSMLLRKARDDFADFDRRFHPLAANCGRAGRRDPGAHDHVGAKLHDVDAVALQRLRQRIEIFIHEHRELVRGLKLCERNEIRHVGGRGTFRRRPGSMSLGRPASAPDL